MALPLPRTVADVEAGGPLATSMRGLNALQQSNLESIIKGAEAKYAPYTNYANAASKIAYSNLLPYQIQAQVLSNPMMWAALQNNPKAINSLMQNFSQSIPSPQQMMAGANMPPPPDQASPSKGILNSLLQKIGIGGEQQQSAQPMNAMVMPATESNQQPLNAMLSPPQSQGQPSGQDYSMAPGGMAGVSGSMTKPYNQQWQTPGETFSSPTGERSAPTGQTVSDIQQSINAVKRVTPQIERIADQAKPFLTLEGGAKLFGQRIGNLFSSKKFGGDLPSQYAEFKASLKTAPEALVKAYGINPTNETLDRMQQVLEPLVGETQEGYKDRVLRSLENIKKEQVGVGEEQLKGGFPLNEQQESKPEAKKNQLPEGRVQKTKMLPNGNQAIMINGKWYGA